MSENCQNLKFVIDISEFPQSWHFFENHNSLETYKYGFLLSSLRNNRHLNNEFILKKNVLFNLEQNIIEMSERMLWLFSFPAIKLGRYHVNYRFTSTYRLCQLKPLENNVGEKITKTMFNVITLELKDGRLIRLLVIFKRIGLWLNSTTKTQLFNKTRKSEALNINNRENCICKGTESTESLRLNLNIPGKRPSKINITIPIILFNSSDTELSTFLQSNNIDGIFGISSNTFALLKKNNGLIFDPLEAINKKINPENDELLLTFDCKNIESVVKKDQILNHFILSFYKNKDLNYIDKLKNIKSNPSLDVVVDYNSTITVKTNVVVDLGLFGAEIPDFRLMQIFSILKKKAEQNGNSCNIVKTLLGDVIQCNCKLFIKQTQLKITDSNIGTHIFDLRDFIIGFNDIGSSKTTEKDEKCRLEIYGKKNKSSGYEEKWIFGQVFCKSKSISKLRRKNSAISWEVESQE
ncbi:hypothetical protein FG379_000101 [Cryptosporidium bovis]|uniref:uncharacterized protein n=1 Tax=Cryptosporidium bovis TaxID=310047 RepID=UPI00351A276A|nr:hypothetical protein FG379_000101 [Cryptosporidium bovis]